MVWVIVIAAIVVAIVVIAALVARSRQRTKQIEQGREHREIAQRQEQDADAREQADEIEERVGPLDDGR
jgi:flagellar biosynthesis/type III secretory pathway M-ring protein FliF/YscJ